MDAKQEFYERDIIYTEVTNEPRGKSNRCPEEDSFRKNEGFLTMFIQARNCIKFRFMATIYRSKEQVLKNSDFRRFTYAKKIASVL